MIESCTDMNLFLDATDKLRACGLLPRSSPFDSYRALCTFLDDQTFNKWLSGPKTPEQLHFTPDIRQKLLALSGEHAYAVYKMLEARKDAST